MTLFDWLKALQTAMALTAFVVVITTGSTIVRFARRPFPEGLVLGMAMTLMMVACLLTFGWQSGAYWLAGIDRPMLTPLPIRIVATVFFLTGGAVFVAITQRPPGLTFGPTFALWSTLVMVIVFMIAFIG